MTANGDQPAEPELIAITPASDDTPAAFEPSVGPETQQLLERQGPDADRQRILAQALSVFSRCTLSPGDNHRTVLAVGEVQSGKTLCFETVMALARDNGFGLVILIAGTSNLLLGQSRQRLRRDLGLDEDDVWKRWRHYESPTVDEQGHDFANSVAGGASRKRTILVTVMKNHAQLRALAELLEATPRFDFPTLVIDDEADQASMNALVNKGLQTATYAQILRLRRALPNHVFIQYTATPQAPLLISIADTLSPDVLQLLDPGEGYVGGRDFFPPVPQPPLVRLIPADDAHAVANPDLQHPPPSLHDALRVFIVGVAAGLCTDARGRRSMLIHPSRTRLQHQVVERWVREALGSWRASLASAEGDPDRSETIASFRNAWDDLALTAEDLPEFDRLITLLAEAIYETQVRVVNQGTSGAAQVDWNQAYAWILIGGQMLDRGFTVEGLTVTYMPRGIGGGTADNLQQRSRWLGYKRDYLGLCRVFVEQATLDGFMSYVTHEESMRRELERTVREEIPLREWRRRFLLDPSLRPTRKSVISRTLVSGAIEGWMEQKNPVYPSEVLAANVELVNKMIEELGPLTDDGPHAYVDVRVSEVVRWLLEYRVLDADQATLIGLLLQLTTTLDSDDDPPSRIYFMDRGGSRERAVERIGETEEYRISQLFQGRSSSAAAGSYEGDRSFIATIDGAQRLTVQIHMIVPRDADGTYVTDVKPAPVLAVWVPPELAIGWVIEV